MLPSDGTSLTHGCLPTTIHSIRTLSRNVNREYRAVAEAVHEKATLSRAVAFLPPKVGDVAPARDCHHRVHARQHLRRRITA
jgi:hypothetical protein